MGCQAAEKAGDAGETTAAYKQFLSAGRRPIRLAQVEHAKEWLSHHGGQAKPGS